MPEVVEVCLTALWLNEKLSNKKLTKVTILGGRYSRHPLIGLDFINKYQPFTINKIDSKGKLLWFELTDQKNKHYYILNRFGLEGEWSFTKQEHSGLQFTIIDDSNKELNAFFIDPRNFGTVEIINDQKKLNKELGKLGPDFLKTSFTSQEFYDRITKYITRNGKSIVSTRGNKEIIKVLMDQTISGGLGSGLGNYLSVEILYDCKISPHKKMSDIYNDKQLVYNLANSIKYIIKLSYLNANIGYLEHLDSDMASFIQKLRKEIIDNKNHENNYHPSVILSENDKFTFRVYRQKKDPDGNPIKADKIIATRTTYWSPAVQNL